MNFIRIDGQDLLCCFVLDVTERSMLDNTLRQISEGTVADVGIDFFESLVQQLTTALNVEYAMVAECTNVEKTRVRTLAFGQHDDLLENIEYDLAGTPCDSVIKDRKFYSPTDVANSFRKDAGFESYLGAMLEPPLATIPIRSHSFTATEPFTALA